jgi:hypothetical protein
MDLRRLWTQTVRPAAGASGADVIAYGGTVAADVAGGGQTAGGAATVAAELLLGPALRALGGTGGLGAA